MDEAAELAGLNRGTVVAAAGCGKTDLVARATALLDTRQLILTHTNSGVEALRRRLRRLGVPNDRVSVDTIDGWCLKYVYSYPCQCGGVPFDEEGFIDWDGLRQAMLRLIRTAVAQRVLAASYGGVLVDEYQDCDHGQHALIAALAELLPTRILGDPLQAIFRFRGDPPHWISSVEAIFPKAFELTVPWRWQKPEANPALGDWLIEVRQRMEAGYDVLLSDPRISFVELDSEDAWPVLARDECFAAAGRGGSVVAICKWPADCQRLARMTGGLYQCVEPIEAKDAGRMLRRIESADASERAPLLLEFLGSVASNLEVLEPLRRSDDLLEPTIPELKVAAGHLRTVAGGSGAEAIARALEALAAVPGVKVFRRELMWAATDALRDAGANPNLTFNEALRRRRNLTSHIGRRLARCSVGSTLLVKGMEFDHAVVVHRGGRRGFTLNDMYVALTRGARSLTVLSPTNRIALDDLPDR